MVTLSSRRRPPNGAPTSGRAAAVSLLLSVPLWLALAAADEGAPGAWRNRNQTSLANWQRSSEDTKLTGQHATPNSPPKFLPDDNQTQPDEINQSDQSHAPPQQQPQLQHRNRAQNEFNRYNQQQQQQPQPQPQPQPQQPQQQHALDDQNQIPLLYETPETRRQLTTYILGEFHQVDMNSVLDKSQLELSRKDVFGQVIAEPLDEAHSTFLASNESGVYDTPTPYPTNTSLSRPYFGEVFESFQTLYWPIHCVIGLVICSVGIIANLINVIVLTRPNMISAVNTILCAIACSDLIVNVSNIPYLMHELADSSNLASYYSYNWAHYILVHAHLTVTLHTISIWLTCALATLRYCVLRSTYSSSQTYSVGTALRVIFGVVILVPVFCIPNYLSFDIVSERTKNQITIYKVGFSSLAEDTQFIKTFHFWIFSCLTKLLPCLLLTYFTSVLIKLLARARERRLRLSNLAEGSTPLVDPRSTPMATPNGHKWTRRKASDNQQQIGAATAAAAAARRSNKQRPSDAADVIDHHKPPLANGLKLGRDNLGQTTDSRDLSSQQRSSALICEDAASSSRGHAGNLGTTRQPAVGDEARNADQQINFEGLNKLRRDKSQRLTNSQGQLTDAGALHEMATSMAKAISNRDVEPANMNISADKGGNNNNNININNNNNLCCQLATHSGSSCATDAECLQVTGSVSSNGSSSIEQAVQQQLQQQSHLTPPLHVIQQQQHNHNQYHHHHQQPLLVETMLSGVKPTSSTTTTTTTRTLMIDKNNTNEVRDLDNDEDGTRLDGASELVNCQREKNLLDPSHGSLGPRSVSTGAALELYAINNEGRSGTESRLTKISLAKQSLQQGSMDDRSGPLLNDAGEKGNITTTTTTTTTSTTTTTRKTLGTNRSGSATLQGSANDEHNPEGLTATMLDQTQRPRSIGSASFAPLQIVRFQATHRQLSQNETTTRLLIAVIIVFLICEFPAGILAALCAVLGQDFFDNVYQPMGTFTDLLALINSSVNFMIYCFMSTQFRVTFYRVVLHCPAPREMNTNNR